MDIHAGSLVWVTKGDNQLAGTVAEVLNGGKDFSVKTTDNNYITVKAADARAMHDTSIRGVEDMIHLSELHESSLLYNLRLRYGKQEIYTYTGTILVAVNPYAELPNYYNLAMVRQYDGVPIGELPPHIFAIGNATYHALLRTKVNQCVVISGESGAGKTESTKLIIQNFAAMSAKQSLIQEQIIEASPIMEAFGNAKTVRNDNSSRFGKFIEIQFDASGTILGARIRDFLLERSRIVHQSTDERNYHIFYCFLAGASKEERETLRLGSPTDYHYLNQSGCVKVPKLDDAADFEKIKSAMKVLNFGPIERSIFDILAAVLHLGNVAFKKKDEDHVEVSNPTTPAFVASLLGLEADKMTAILTTRAMTQRGETFISPLLMQQAIDSRDALGKALYGRMFSRILQNINNTICKSGEHPFVGVLDIFGFEDFKENSFEQFCINYANEKLQFYFNQHIFKLEQEEYDKEAINWSKIAFVDNQDCIDLLSKKPFGLVWLMDEEANFPKATDKSLLVKMTDHHKKTETFVKPKLNDSEFAVKHYAGTVSYQIEGILDKNRDTLRTDVLEALMQSTKPFVVDLFKDDMADVGGSMTLSRNGTTRKQSTKAPTVAGAFHQSLTDLIATLSECNPYFVRCIKPNSDKSAHKFEDELVLAQLRYSGMLETIRIRRLGFPVRLGYKDFWARYKLLDPKQDPKDLKRCATNIMKNVWKNEEDFQFGKTKLFMRNPVENALEDLRGKLLIKYVLRLQTTFRMALARIKYRRTLKAIVTAQRMMRGFLRRRQYKKEYKLMIFLQACLRGQIVRRRLSKELATAREKKSAERQASREKAEAELKEIQEQRRAAAERDGRTFDSEDLEITDDMSEEERSRVLKERELLMYLETTAQTRKVKAKKRDKTVRAKIAKKAASAAAMPNRNPVVVAAMYQLPPDLQENVASTQVFALPGAKADIAREAASYTLPIIKTNELNLDGTSFAEFVVALNDPKAPPAVHDLAKQIGNDISGFTYNKFHKAVYRDGMSPAYSDVPIFQSLTVLPDDMERIAVDVNKLVLKFIHEDFLTDVFYLRMINTIIRLTREVEVLRDEILAQFLKQTFFNSEKGYEQRAWHFFAIFLGLLAPSRNLFLHLLNYIVCEAPEYISGTCQRRLIRARLNGPRKNPLTFMEYEALKGDLPGVPVDASFCDGTSCVLAVDVSTTAKEFIDAALATKNIDSTEGWVVYAHFNNTVQAVPANDLMMDVVSGYVQRMCAEKGDDPTTEYKEGIMVNVFDTPVVKVPPKKTAPPPTLVPAEAAPSESSAAPVAEKAPRAAKEATASDKPKKEKSSKEDKPKEDKPKKEKSSKTDKADKADKADKTDRTAATPTVVTKTGVKLPELSEPEKPLSPVAPKAPAVKEVVNMPTSPSAAKAAAAAESSSSKEKLAEAAPASPASPASPAEPKKEAKKDKKEEKKEKEAKEKEAKEKKEREEKEAKEKKEREEKEKKEREEKEKKEKKEKEKEEKEKKKTLKSGGTLRKLMGTLRGSKKDAPASVAGLFDESSATASAPAAPPAPPAPAAGGPPPPPPPPAAPAAPAAPPPPPAPAAPAAPPAPPAPAAPPAPPAPAAGGPPPPPPPPPAGAGGPPPPPPPPAAAGGPPPPPPPPPAKAGGPPPPPPPPPGGRAGGPPPPPPPPPGPPAPGVPAAPGAATLAAPVAPAPSLYPFRFELRKQYLKPQVRFDDSDNALVSLQVVQSDAAQKQDGPIKSLLSAAYEARDFHKVIEIANNWPLYFVRFFNAKEPISKAFGVGVTHRSFHLLTSTGLNAKSLYDCYLTELYIISASTTEFKAVLKKQTVTIQTNGIELQDYIVRLIKEVKNISTRAMAIRDHIVDDYNLLSFRIGDHINIREREGEDGWFRGECGDRAGWFPCESVEILYGPVPSSDVIKAHAAAAMIDLEGAISKAEEPFEKTEAEKAPEKKSEKKSSKKAAAAAAAAAPGEVNTAFGSMRGSKKLNANFVAAIEAAHAGDEPPPAEVEEPSTVPSLQAAIAQKAIVDEAKESEKEDRELLGETAAKKFTMMEYAKNHYRIETQPETSLGDDLRRGTLRGSLRRGSVASVKLQRRESADAAWGWRDLASKIKYSKDPLKTSLHKTLDNTDNKVATDCFMAVMSFMGDFPSKNTDTQIVQHIVGIGIKKEGLRDELYCQIVKQVTNNKSFKEDSARRGWDLFALCASSFPCSETLAPYLTSFLNSHAEDTSREFHEEAATCLRYLQRVRRIGPRKLPPNAPEIMAVKTGTPMSMRVHFPGDISRMIMVDSVCTASDVLSRACAKIQLTSGEDEFGLFILASNGSMAPILADDFILDVLSVADRMATVAAGAATIRRQSEPKERQQPGFVVACRRKLFTKANAIGSSDLATTLIYHQVLADFNNGTILSAREIENSSLNEFSELVGLQLVAQSGFNRQLLADEAFITTVVPQAVLLRQSPSQWQQQIQKYVMQLASQGMDEMAARKQFLSRVSMWTLYGSASYEFTSASDKRFNNGGILNINESGIRVLDATTHVELMQTPYDSIVNFRYDESEFILKTGDLMSKSMVRFYTKDGFALADLVQGYIRYHVNKRQKAQPKSPRKYTDM